MKQDPRAVNEHVNSAASIFAANGEELFFSNNRIDQTIGPSCFRLVPEVLSSEEIPHTGNKLARCIPHIRAPQTRTLF